MAHVACLPIVLDESVPWPPSAPHVLKCRACAIRLAVAATMGLSEQTSGHETLRHLLNTMAKPGWFDEELQSTMALTAQAAHHHTLTWHDLEPMMIRVRAAYAKRPLHTANAHRTRRV